MGKKQQKKKPRKTFYSFRQNRECVSSEDSPVRSKTRVYSGNIVSCYIRSHVKFCTDEDDDNEFFREKKKNNKKTLSSATFSPPSLARAASIAVTDPATDDDDITV